MRLVFKAHLRMLGKMLDLKANENVFFCQMNKFYENVYLVEWRSEKYMLSNSTVFNAHTNVLREIGWTLPKSKQIFP